MSLKQVLLGISLRALCGCAAMGGPDGSLRSDGGDADADDPGENTGDGDSDVDADDPMEIGDEETESLCSDGYDNNENGLVDCVDPGCSPLGVCCEAEGDVSISDDFVGPLDTQQWRPLGDQNPIIDGLLRPAGDNAYDNGVVSRDAVPVVGRLELGIDAQMPATCKDGCTELLGAAFTSTGLYADSPIVDVVAGVVFDLSSGELVVIVHGSVQRRFPGRAQDAQSLTVSIQADRRVVVSDPNAVLYTSDGPIDPALEDLYIALFGRGGQQAGFEEVSLESSSCSLPSVRRAIGNPVLAPGGAAFLAGAVQSPSVTLAVDGRVEMYFTGVGSVGSAIGLAIGDPLDQGFALDPTTPVIDSGDLPDGYANPADPSVIHLDDELLAAVSVASNGNPSLRQIALLSSDQGIIWSSIEVLPLQLPGHPDGQALCRSARDPELVELPLGGFEMYFTCESDVGAPSIGRVTSTDGHDWNVDGIVVLSPLLPEEIDGVAAPAVTADGDGIRRMWFEARDGFVRTVGYAASADGIAWTRWSGRVLGPGEPGNWDDLSVGAPDALISEGSPERLYFTGQSGAGGGIGLAKRDAPRL